MKVGIQLYLAGSSLSNTVYIIEIFLVSIVLDLPFTTGFIKLNYSHNLDRFRITLRLMRR